MSHCVCGFYDVRRQNNEDSENKGRGKNVMGKEMEGRETDEWFKQKWEMWKNGNQTTISWLK